MFAVVGPELGGGAIEVKRVAPAYLAFLCLLAVGFGVGGELIVRYRGGQPWRFPLVQTRVEPGGQFFAPHPTLGYTHLPGHFDVTLKRSYTFGVTHGSDGLRITSDRPRAASDDLPEIWIFGCSLTHGWSLNDDETYPWRLQTLLPAYRVVNFGVDGYGTVQALIQFREALKQRRAPAIAVVAYASFHDIRNTFLRQRRKTVAPLNRLGPLRQPVARLGQDGALQISMADVVYREVPGMRHSALIHLAEQTYDRFEDVLYRSHDVSRALLLAFRDEAERAGVKLVVAGIARDESRRLALGHTTADMLAFTAAHGILSVDISVDLADPANVNLPHDFHPSPLANVRYANALDAFLRDQGLVDAEPARADIGTARATGARSRGAFAASMGHAPDSNRERSRPARGESHE